MPQSRLNLYPARPLHPVHAVLLGGCLPLFLGALLTDWAYAASFEVQWKNFAAWLLVGALLFSGFAMLFALVDLVRGLGRGLIYFVILLASFGLGLVNEFVHAKDGWASMPMALILSVITAALIVVACWFGFATIRAVRVTKAAPTTAYTTGEVR